MTPRSRSPPAASRPSWRARSAAASRKRARRCMEVDGTMATVAEPKVERKSLVHYQVEDGVGILELDYPPANTYTHEMMRQLDEAILQARFDDEVHVIILRGKGERFFCAGADI